ncbi:MAG: hypothetical protein AAF846_23685 [Chloroflexota bacterium]
MEKQKRKAKQKKHIRTNTRPKGFITKWVFAHFTLTTLYIFTIVAMNHFGLLNDTFSWTIRRDNPATLAINYHAGIIMILLLIVQKNLMQNKIQRLFRHWYTSGVVTFIALAGYAFFIELWYDVTNFSQVFVDHTEIMIGLSIILLSCLYIPQGWILWRNSQAEDDIVMYVIISTAYSVVLLATTYLAFFLIIVFWIAQGAIIKKILMNPKPKGA